MRHQLLDYYRSIVAAARQCATPVADILGNLDGEDRLASAAFIDANGRRHPWFRFHVERGDRARDARQWKAGFEAYRAGLDILPLHGGYLVQAGHCLKELGRYIAAEGYYRSGLLLGAPLADVEAHLVHVSRHTQYFLDPGRIRQLAAAVRDDAAEIRGLPTLDELEALAAQLGVLQHVDVAVLVGLMREGVTLGQAADRIGIHARWRFLSRTPLAPPARRQRLDVLVSTGHNNAWNAGAGANGHGTVTPAIIPAATQVEPRPEAPGVEPTTAAVAACPPGASTGEVFELAQAFARNRHDRAAPTFFGAVPQRESMGNVSLSPSARPEVSVVILNHNGSALALLAAGSVLASTCPVAYEIIVVDNGSEPDEVALLEEANLPVRTLRLPENRGFGEGNNIGAETARGTYLLFLNSDAFVAPGTIEAMLAAFDGVDDCGAVGAVLRYPDGTLQEAGALVWPDGGTQRRGRQEQDFAVAQLPRFDVVDYVSGACLLIGRKTFSRGGGFRPAYDPAYCEDVDLCLRLQQDRKVVVVAREAACYHIENATISAGKGAAATLPLIAQLNQSALLGTWGPYLASRLPTDIPARREASSGKTRGKVKQTLSEAEVVAFVDGPFRSGAAERYLLALAGAAGRDGPAVLAAPDRWSEIRLRNIEEEAGCRAPLDASVAADDLADTWIGHLLALTSRPLPSGLARAHHSALVCVAPRAPAGATRDDLLKGTGHLARFQCLIVPSKAARQALLSITGDAAGVAERIAIIAPPAVSAPIDDRVAGRQPWILSVGPIGDPGPDGGLDIIAEAFARTGQAFRRDWRLLLCGDVVDPALADKTISRIRATAEQAGARIDIIVSPPRERLASPYRQAAVYVQATGGGIAGTEPTWRHDLLGLGVRDAAAAGCLPIAWHVGAGPEVLEALGVGHAYSSVDELVDLMQLCDTAGNDARIDRVAEERFGDAVFAKAVHAALSVEVRS